MSSSEGSTAGSDSAEMADSFLLAVIVGGYLMIFRIEREKSVGKKIIKRGQILSTRIYDGYGQVRDKNRSRDSTSNSGSTILSDSLFPCLQCSRYNMNLC